jgi:hypothetical protein
LRELLSPSGGSGIRSGHEGGAYELAGIAADLDAPLLHAGT